MSHRLSLLKTKMLTLPWTKTTDRETPQAIGRRAASPRPMANPVTMERVSAEASLEVASSEERDKREDVATSAAPEANEPSRPAARPRVEATETGQASPALSKTEEDEGAPRSRPKLPPEKRKFEVATEEDVEAGACPPSEAERGPRASPAESAADRDEKEDGADGGLRRKTATPSDSPGVGADPLDGEAARGGEARPGPGPPCS